MVWGTFESYCKDVHMIEFLVLLLSSSLPLVGVMGAKCFSIECFLNWNFSSWRGHGVTVESKGAVEMIVY